MQCFCKLQFDCLIHVNETECLYFDVIIKTMQNDVSQRNKTYTCTSFQIRNLHKNTDASRVKLGLRPLSQH